MSTIITKESQIDANLRKQMYDKAWLSGNKRGQFTASKKIKEAISELDISEEVKQQVFAVMPKFLGNQKERLQKRKEKLLEQLQKVKDAESELVEESA